MLLLAMKGNMGKGVPNFFIMKSCYTCSHYEIRDTLDGICTVEHNLNKPVRSYDKRCKNFYPHWIYNNDEYWILQ